MIGIFFLLLKIKLCYSKNIWQQSKLTLDSKFDDINSLFVDVSVRCPGCPKIRAPWEPDMKLEFHEQTEVDMIMHFSPPENDQAV